VAETGVRAEQQEEVRELRHGGTQIRARAALPEVADQLAVPAVHLLRVGRVCHAKAGTEDDRLDLPLDAVGINDRALSNLAQPAGHELDVLLSQCPVPAV
jgi:hypothetical protein